MVVQNLECLIGFNCFKILYFYLYCPDPLYSSRTAFKWKEMFTIGNQLLEQRQDYIKCFRTSSIKNRSSETDSTRWKGKWISSSLSFVFWIYENSFETFRGSFCVKCVQNRFFLFFWDFLDFSCRLGFTVLPEFSSW